MGVSLRKLHKDRRFVDTMLNIPWWIADSRFGQMSAHARGTCIALDCQICEAEKRGK